MSSDKIKRTIRAPHGKDRPYFLMVRATAQDARLSFEARGLLAYILSKPDDWIVQYTDLKKHGIGRDKANRLFKELEANLYLVREQDRGDKGKFSTSDWRIQETPFTENPFTGEPLTVNPQLHNRESLEKKEKTSSAPNGTGGGSSKKRQRDELIDTLTEKLFKAQLTNRKKMALAGINAAWLRGTSTGTESINVGRNQYPSNDPQEVIDFVEWWNDTKPTYDNPTGISSFAKWWREWCKAGKPKVKPKDAPIQDDGYGKTTLSLLGVDYGSGS